MQQFREKKLRFTRVFSVYLQTMRYLIKLKSRDAACVFVVSAE